MRQVCPPWRFSIYKGLQRRFFFTQHKWLLATYKRYYADLQCQIDSSIADARSSTFWRDRKSIFRHRLPPALSANDAETSRRFLPHDTHATMTHHANIGCHSRTFDAVNYRPVKIVLRADDRPIIRFIDVEEIWAGLPGIECSMRMAQRLFRYFATFPIYSSSSIG